MLTGLRRAHAHLGPVALALALAFAALAVAACAEPADGPVDAPAEGSEEAAVEQALNDALEAYNAGDAVSFAALSSDAFLEDVFGTTREEATEALADMMGQPPLTFHEISDITVTGNTATAKVRKSEGTVQNPQVMMLVSDGETWRLDALGDLLPVSVPDGAKVVDLEMIDNEFVIDTEEITTGNVAFAATNRGTSEHDVVLLRAADGVTLEDMAAEDFDAWNMTPVGYAGPFQPGTSGNIVLDEPLAPGNYRMLCGIAGEDGMPHAMAGMIQDFTVP
jgi:hypothetical protein